MTTVRRGVLDACLLENARSAGVSIFEGEVVHQIRGDSVLVTRYRSLTARIVVGADGRHSRVASQAGLACRSRPQGGPVAFQSHFRAPPSLDDRVHLFLFDGGYCGLVRVDADHANLCIVTRQSARGEGDRGNCERLFARTVWRNPRFRRIGPDPEPLESWRSAHPLWGAANRPQNGRVLLVGDALRTLEPFTGQGIYFALRTGELAARAITDGEDYAATITTLYRWRGRTNRLLRRFMYHSREAAVAMSLLKVAPSVQQWLANQVLSG